MNENEVQNVRAGLSLIVDWFDEGGQREKLGTVKFYELLAQKLNELAGKSWTWRYVQGVHRGSVGPSVDFRRAVEALGATLDDAPVQVAYTVQVSVLARPGTVPAGTLILGEARHCQWPGCRVRYVPRVPWQKYCDSGLHAAAERKQRKAKKGK